jgi:hypothetical protein
LTARAARPGEDGARPREEDGVTEAGVRTDEARRLLDGPAAAAGGRKVRLFALACVRRVLALAGAAASREAVETAARFAEGRADSYELHAADAAALDACFLIDAAGLGPKGADPARTAAARAKYAAARAVAAAVKAQHCGRPACAASHAAYYAAWAADEAGRADERAEQARLFRDIFGGARRPAAPQAAWLRWNDGCVERMARHIYDEERFADLPILADALEDAGCDDPDVLGHCRAGGAHARGCWVLDLLLGKE